MSDKEKMDEEPENVIDFASGRDRVKKKKAAEQAKKIDKGRQEHRTHRSRDAKLNDALSKFGSFSGKAIKDRFKNEKIDPSKDKKKDKKKDEE